MEKENEQTPAPKQMQLDIIKHGLTYYGTEINDINCPECSAENIIITDEPSVMEFECQKCFCVFRIVRAEGGTYNG